MSDKDDSLTNIIFQRSRSQQLVFEIAFGPAIAFAVDQTSPTGAQGAILYWVMAGLIGIPILRYLVFTDRIARFVKLLDLTVRPVELFALLGVIQIFKYLGIELIRPISRLTVIEATAVVTVVATFSYIVAFELIFRKYRFSWGTLFFFKRHDLERHIDIAMDDAEEVIQAILEPESPWRNLKVALSLLKLTLIRVTYGQAALHLLKDSIPDRDDPLLDDLRTYVEVNKDTNRITDSKGLWFAFTISAAVILPLLIMIAWLISLVVGTFGSIVLVLIIMRLAKHIVALSYIAFGTLDYEQFVTTNKQWFIMIAGYTLLVYLLIFSPP